VSSKRRGITSSAELERALDADRELLLRYEKALAFRLGIDSVVYDATYGGGYRLPASRQSTM
jgi:hypothetical protein